MIYACGCHCGNTDGNIRRFLKDNGYKDWGTIDIAKGKEASRRIANLLPPTDETDMLHHFLDTASQWEIIIGTNGKVVKWSDIGHNQSKSTVEGQAIIEVFA